MYGSYSDKLRLFLLSRIARLLAFILSIYMCNPLWATTMTSPMRDVTIVVSSCDKYSPLWKPFFTLLFQHWPSLETSLASVPILLISEKKSFDHPRIQNIRNDPEYSWSDNMLNALRHVKTPYVLYLQEDYLLYRPVDQARLESIIRSVKLHCIPFISLNPDRYFKHCVASSWIRGAVKKYPNMENQVTLQVMLIETALFRSLLQCGESPWMFEYAGTKRARKINRPFFALIKDHPFHLINACRWGGLLLPAYQYLRYLGFQNVAGRTLPIVPEINIHPTQVLANLHLDSLGCISQDLKKRSGYLSSWWKTLWEKICTLQ
jgi:hypothetical protein